MSSATDLDSARPPDLAIKCLGRVPIDIFRNSMWAGSGYLRDGRIVDCYATQLGRDGIDTEAIYEAIEQAIACGDSILEWPADSKLTFTWRLGVNGN